MIGVGVDKTKRLGVQFFARSANALAQAFLVTTCRGGGLRNGAIATGLSLLAERVAARASLFPAGRRVEHSKNKGDRSDRAPRFAVERADGAFPLEGWLGVNRSIPSQGALLLPVLVRGRFVREASGTPEGLPTRRSWRGMVAMFGSFPAARGSPGDREPHRYGSGSGETGRVLHTARTVQRG